MASPTNWPMPSRAVPAELAIVLPDTRHLHRRDGIVTGPSPPDSEPGLLTGQRAVGSAVAAGLAGRRAAGSVFTRSCLSSEAERGVVRRAGGGVGQGAGSRMAGREQRWSLARIKTLIGRRFHKSMTLSGISQMLRVAGSGITRTLNTAVREAQGPSKCSTPGNRWCWSGTGCPPTGAVPCVPGSPNRTG
ncbi:winged helix-turn-helix domain-containing protein [Streptomyces sp. NPDC048479]|uniref:winged helix-turn-helix domain-containing protein n=1 Tax=Streptomyces sp. NPDC048479 TaxID=3154725 RepID=UPI0034205E14